MIQIKATTPVYDLVHAHPDIVGIMVDIGFTRIADPAVLNTVGHFVDLRKGARLMQISLAKVKQDFAKAGYEVVDNDQ
ncbi:DUF1858 domain-containing protein [Schleiferilactobacillus harbinensis]|jgi:hypothetical protein|uniref:DUF1858 domain-containing protein n=2 Tax=Schleiferilactobacillus harbinensis TaxID=304207 RepID=A0A0R1X6N0_9LACO|nr:DUF1858 domain-containing protein [Schleiferilactobacillus harbinensis]KRM25461.1 hypothetical protein FC91_GL000785 [Schleiferilactobacillus harbinensis DSM 16991]MCT2908109.1 DUF1858 domain-containing protein [Schleiferilactobacillus harbinensis]QFR64593.1 DUF1858 domain-containing protein [Schleiferilactobacillus harbinensis]GEK06728.1 hypothetical protein LHA01_19670 [Schleiferilactobacillus harbinensis]